MLNFGALKPRVKGGARIRAWNLLVFLYQGSEEQIFSINSEVYLFSAKVHIYWCTCPINSCTKTHILYPESNATCFLCALWNFEQVSIKRM